MDFDEEDDDIILTSGVTIFQVFLQNHDSS